MCWQSGLISGTIYDFFLISHDFLMNVLSILCQKIWKLLTLLLWICIQLYLAVIFSLTGVAHPDSYHWVSTQRDWREVGRLLGWGADAVLHTGCAFHREEFGAWRCTSREKKKKTHDKTPWSTVINHILRSKMPAVGVKSSMWRYNSHQVWWSDYTPTDAGV